LSLSDTGPEHRHARLRKPHLPGDPARLDLGLDGLPGDLVAFAALVLFNLAGIAVDFFIKQ
jgi:hypothetical protein